MMIEERLQAHYITASCYAGSRYFRVLPASYKTISSLQIREESVRSPENDSSSGSGELLQQLSLEPVKFALSGPSFSLFSKKVWKSGSSIAIAFGEGSTDH